ncbi:MAG: efflux transporter outer membrane subunit [Acidocella sp.]|nr:efflux transporter outer membrane subunit [Acidocella sp.]
MSSSLCALLALSACEVGPNYHAPAAPLVASLTPNTLAPSTMVAGGEAQSFVIGGDISGDWWRLFHSPELNALINTALANNPTLQASQQTLLQARENVRAAYGQLVPSLSAGFQAERQQPSSASAASFGGGAKQISPFTLYNASLSVSYGLDIWGGARRDVESLQAQADFQRYQLEAAYLSLTANIVTAAVNEASLNAQISATNSIVAAEQKQLDILKRQYALGGVAKANIISQQASLASAEASLPPLQSQLAQLRNQLADYVGKFPADFHEADFTLASLHLPETIPASLPSEMVNQRPDIQAAAEQLHEASANVGVTTAQMLPQITLSASVGHDALTTASLFTPQTLLWSLIAGVTQPVFQGGELAAKRQASIAALHVAGAQYQATVLAAFQNVANALQALQYDAQTLQAAQLAEDSSAQSLAVVQSQFKYGSQPFTAVLTAQTNYQTSLVARVKAQATRLSDTAALFQALGGGWWHRDDVSSAVKTCCGIIP